MTKREGDLHYLFSVDDGKKRRESTETIPLRNPKLKCGPPNLPFLDLGILIFSFQNVSGTGSKWYRPRPGIKLSGSYM